MNHPKRNEFLIKILRPKTGPKMGQEKLPKCQCIWSWKHGLKWSYIPSLRTRSKGSVFDLTILVVFSIQTCGFLQQRSFLWNTRPFILTLIPKMYLWENKGKINKNSTEFWQKSTYNTDIGCTWIFVCARQIKMCSIWKNISFISVNIYF